VLGDLDITDDLTIAGAGIGATIVDGNGAVTNDRVFQVLASAKIVTISGLTIRNGKRTGAFDEGGGLFWQGNNSHFNLNDVSIDSNTSPYGGGIFLSYSTQGDIAVFDHITIHGNTSTAAAGGLGADFGDFATFTLAHSQVYGNAAFEGAGLYFQGRPASGLSSVHVQNTDIYSNNAASLSGGIENHSGAVTGPVFLVNDSISNNQASTYGGGIGNYGALSIINSTLDANNGGMRGGGIYDYEGGVVNIDHSTLSRNTAQNGGAIFSELFTHIAPALTLTDSTLSGNSATQDGGGIYAQGGTLSLFNTTVAGNQLVLPNGVSGVGGGVFQASPAVINMKNVILADNTQRHSLGLPAPDDCFGNVVSGGYNLIETTANCTIGGTLTGVITASDPRLGSLGDNGGATQTQALLAGSPAIDAGETPACLDANSAPIPSDQRGFPRSMGGRCDIGAVEYQPFNLYLVMIEK
jgi:predicted outer membrane repeat protein